MLPASRKNFLKFTEIVNMSTIRIPTSFNIDLEFDIPEFHRRFFAWIIDYGIIYIYWRVAQRLALAFLSGPGGMVYYDAVAIAWEITGIPILLYFLLSEIWMNGQSLGKKAMRIRVVNMNGGKPNLGQFIIRLAAPTGRLSDDPLSGRAALGDLLQIFPAPGRPGGGHHPDQHQRQGGSGRNRVYGNRPGLRTPVPSGDAAQRPRPQYRPFPPGEGKGQRQLPHRRDRRGEDQDRVKDRNDPVPPYTTSWRLC